MRRTRCTLSILAAGMVLATVPSASADSISTIDLFVGSTQVATATGSVGSTCGAGNICVTITGFGGNQIRTGGPTVGFSGSGLTGLGISGYTDSGNIGSGTCGGMKGQTLCFDVSGKGANGAFNSVSLILTGASNVSSVTGIGIHVIGPACGTGANGGFNACFTSSSTPVTPPPTVPEPGTTGNIQAPFSPQSRKRRLSRFRVVVVSQAASRARIHQRHVIERQNN